MACFESIWWENKQFKVESNNAKVKALILLLVGEMIVVSFVPGWFVFIFLLQRNTNLVFFQGVQLSCIILNSCIILKVFLWFDWMGLFFVGVMRLEIGELESIVETSKNVDFLVTVLFLVLKISVDLLVRSQYGLKSRTIVFSCFLAELILVCFILL